MGYSYAVHYIAAFLVVVVGTGVLAMGGFFEKDVGVTALVPAEVPEPIEPQNETNSTDGIEIPVSPDISTIGD